MEKIIMYRGFLRKNLDELEGFFAGDAVPIEALAIQEKKELDFSAFDVKVHRIISKGGVVLLEMPIDAPENIQFLKGVAKQYKNQGGVWFGIRAETGSEEAKIEKLTLAYDTLRLETKSKIVIRSIRSNGTCSPLMAKKREFINVVLSIPFDKIEKNEKDAIDTHLKRLESIEACTKLETITHIIEPKRPPTGGCQACKIYNEDEMKALIEGLKIEDTEKKQLQVALDVMLAKPEQTGEKEIIRALVTNLNQHKRSWYAEGGPALIAGHLMIA